MSKVQTDNSHFEEKVLLRVGTVNSIGKEKISVLEAFAGNGLIWKEVKKRIPSVSISVLRIDQKRDRVGVYLVGDNLKYLSTLSLNTFDIIDLDAYGTPTKQLKIIFDRGFKGIVHCTFIQSGFGMLDDIILTANGFTKEMVNKCPILFCRNGMDKMENYLAKNGIKSIHGYFIDRKNYFWFKIA